MRRKYGRLPLGHEAAMLHRNIKLETRMADKTAPDENSPLSPLAFMQENFSAWRDFTANAGRIMKEQAGQMKAADAKDVATETATADILRVFSEYNLRRWQNTARLLDGMPDWMSMPQMITGAPLVDWFDRMRRGDMAFQYEADKVGTEDYTVAPTPAAMGSALRQPTAIKAPEGHADDLTRIKGIGPKLSKLLNELGIFHFKQIASWSEPEAAWVDDFLAFKGRVSREAWITQARTYVSNGDATLH
jgi:predicted flap endonuclease-1-like 5' DNA nuclease